MEFKQTVDKPRYMSSRAKPKSRDLKPWKISPYRSLHSLHLVEMTRKGYFLCSLRLSCHYLHFQLFTFHFFLSSPVGIKPHRFGAAAPPRHERRRRRGRRAEHWRRRGQRSPAVRALYPIPYVREGAQPPLPVLIAKLVFQRNITAPFYAHSCKAVQNMR